jgi:hypothetical protein
MTQAATETKTAKKNGQTAAAEDEFVEYVIDRASFKPELFTKRDENKPEKEIYIGLPVQGFVLGHVSMGKIYDEEKDEEREAFAYVFKLSRPTKVKDRSGDVVEAKVGEEIYVWENAQMKQAVPPTAANHPAMCLHIRVTPLFRAPLPGEKKKLWHFDFKLAPPKSRKEIGGGGSIVAQLLATAPKQLPEGGDGTPF